MASIASLSRRWPEWVPQGSVLPDEVWASRHRWVMSVLVVQAAAIVPFALAQGYTPVHALVEASIPAILAALAALRGLPNVARASLAGVGLMIESAIAVHLSGGVIEAHFHFFVMIPIVAMYESWVPFGLAVGFVLFQHGIIGTLNSSSVYNHPSAREHPWWWAGIHAVLFGCACLGALANWVLHERARGFMSQLTRATERDPLTMLPNRVGLKRLGQESIGGGTQVSLLLVDLDGFKDVNDTLGHAGGDNLLRLVADRLPSALGQDDVLGRLGGDEFVVVLAGRGTDGARAVAEQLRDALAESFSVHGMTLHVGGSVGISTWSPPSGEQPPAGGTAAATMTELLRQADVAMYAAKQSRSGTAVYDVAQDREIHRRITFISEFRRALDNDELVVHFQPKVRLPSGDTSGLEALLRWQHPKRGLIRPTDLIRTAEKTALIDKLTVVVLRKALAAVREWHDAGRIVGVSVNISPYTLPNPHLVQTVDRLLDEYGLDGRWLCLEITEDVLIVGQDDGLSALKELKKRGLTISIDDFGSGYSSMSYLQRLPADELKIDRSLISGLGHNPPLHHAQSPERADHSLVIVRSTIELGHSLGLRVVAEGVETAETLATLTSLGCDEVQGYVIARPMPGDSVLPWLAEPHACLARLPGRGRAEPIEHTA